jgi:hypothetical protein
MDRARFGATCFRLGAASLILCALFHGFEIARISFWASDRTDGFNHYFPVGLAASALLSLTIATRRRRDPALLRSAAVANIVWLLPTIGISFVHWSTAATTLLGLSAIANAAAFWLLPNDYY